MATGLVGRFVQRAGYSVPEAPPEGRLYYRPAALSRGRRCWHEPRFQPGRDRPSALGPRPAQDLRHRRAGAQGRLARRAARRFLRAARSQRRRQVDPDRHRQFAGQQELGRGADVRRRPARRPRRGDAPDRAGAAGNELQHVREAVRHPGQLRRVLRHAARRGDGARRGGTQARAAVGQGADACRARCRAA